jgi:hypothetical protein
MQLLRSEEKEAEAAAATAAEKGETKPRKSISGDAVAAKRASLSGDSVKRQSVGQVAIEKSPEDMSVKELKVAVAAAGLSRKAAGFSEKQEFVTLLRSSGAAKPPPQAAREAVTTLKRPSLKSAAEAASAAPLAKKEKEKEEGFVHSELGPSVVVLDVLEMVWVSV